MLLTADLQFEYPENLVATSALARGKSRILHISRDRDQVEEINWSRFLAMFKKGDTLVLNDSKVLWARLIIEKQTGSLGEIFFLKTLANQKHWEILSKGMNLKVGKTIDLPGDLKAKVLKTGRISEIEIEQSVDLAQYFLKHGNVPLPPYIIQARENQVCENIKLVDQAAEDKTRYQNVWAQNLGSVAAPTAGLHFGDEHLKYLRESGVKIVYVTLHVGAGTFLPIETEKLSDFQIHPEIAIIEPLTCEAVRRTQATGKKVWACGTTATRALESAVWASGTGGTNIPMIVPFVGETRLFISPGYKFQVVDAMLTNFHQPQSSLLALVSAFGTRMIPEGRAQELKTLQKILNAYKFAIDKKFRLFSYGDLTVLS
ncbi:MAG: tRNA preQ1(34) S-adenosylmethionine ribosyltransferase-isomerase QueA [Oligoflexia bacterium]|nr:tRNA preQ1(34) S-adenosylmethionine ribosyltransferase-isomerase QueA [Oligoflexia bacterium]